MPNKLENSYLAGKAVQPLQSVKKTIRIAVSPVMDMPGDFTQGVDFIKMWEWFGRFGVGVFWLMVGK